MNLSVDSNATEYTRALTEFIRFYAVAIPKALRHQGRLLAQEFTRKTPPNTRAQGRRAVARDIKRAVRPLRPQDFSTKDIRALIRKRDYHGLEAVFSKFPESSELRNVSVVEFTSALHSEIRDRRGRVKKFQRKVTPDYDQVRDYITRTQSHVGQAKGGWAESLLRLGGRPAAWIAQHVHAGTFEDYADTVHGYIHMENRSEWAGGGDEDRVITNSLRSRSTAMLAALVEAQDNVMKQSFGGPAFGN